MKHIILIGFKHVGKSAIGQKLADELECSHVDLDNLIEQKHCHDTNQSLNCRQIMNELGAEHFRSLEKQVLENLLLQEKNEKIISVGGGTPLDEENRRLISEHRVVHVVAPRGIVFERIMVNGKPAFFPDNGDDFETFLNIWEERIPVFESIAETTIENDGSIQNAVDQIKVNLKI
ncbi:MAG: shikimate kinase [Candidatus Magasanikiibacteriota bacterium]